MGFQFTTIKQSWVVSCVDCKFNDTYDDMQVALLAQDMHNQFHREMNEVVLRGKLLRGELF